MRLKGYGKNQKKRKEYILQCRLLSAGVDVRRQIMMPDVLHS